MMRYETDAGKWHVKSSVPFIWMIRNKTSKLYLTGANNWKTIELARDFTQSEKDSFKLPNDSEWILKV